MNCMLKMCWDSPKLSGDVYATKLGTWCHCPLHVAVTVVAIAIAVPHVSPSPCVIIPRASLLLCIVAIVPQSSPLCDKVSKCFKQKKKKLTICLNNASAMLQKATSWKIVELHLNVSCTLGKSKLTRWPKNLSTTQLNAMFALRKISNAKIQRKLNSPGHPLAKGRAYL